LAERHCWGSFRLPPGALGRLIRSVNFIVGADTFEQDRLPAFVLHELEDHAQVVTSAAGSRTDELSFELVGLGLGMKSVFGQQGQRRLQFRRCWWMLAGKPPAGTNERRGRQEQPFQARRRLMI
jgi:hypothetical protein